MVKLPIIVLRVNDTLLYMARERTQPGVKKYFNLRRLNIMLLSWTKITTRRHYNKVQNVMFCSRSIGFPFNRIDQKWKKTCVKKNAYYFCTSISHIFECIHNYTNPIRLNVL